LQSNNTILEGLKIYPLRTFPPTGRVQILYEYTNVTNYTFQYYNGSRTQFVHSQIGEKALL